MGRAPAPPEALRATQKGTNGVSANAVTVNFMFFDRGTFWVLPLTYFYLPKSARAYRTAYLFPSVKFVAFAAAPLVLTPFVRLAAIARPGVDPDAASRGRGLLPESGDSRAARERVIAMLVASCRVSLGTMFPERRFANDCLRKVFRSFRSPLDGERS